jgi:hypothetical protein
MRRSAVLLVSVALAAGGCGDGGSLPTSGAGDSSSTSAGATEATTTTGAATTTTGAATTTTGAATTTAAPTTTRATTTTEAGHPVLPDAFPRETVAWDHVGPGWTVVLFSTQSGYADLDSPAEELVVAYLVDPDGAPFEIIRWPVEAAPRWLHDVRPDGRAAILGFDDGAALLDLTTGMVGPLPAGVEGSLVTFTRPTGRDYVMTAGDYRAEMRLADGSLIVDFGEISEWFGDYGVPTPPWLYGPQGLTAVVNRPDGPVLIDNRGNLIRRLDDAGTDCVAVRWWSTDQILMRCLTPAEDRYMVRRLWIVERSGASAPFALSTGDESLLAEGFEGYVDALDADGDILLQGLFAAGGGWFPIELWVPDASPIPLGDAVAGQLVTARSDGFVLFRLGCCGEVYGALTHYDTTGRILSMLDAPEGIFGVLDAHGVGAP